MLFIVKLVYFLIMFHMLFLGVFQNFNKMVCAQHSKYIFTI